jgi:hypothetical protein
MAAVRALKSAAEGASPQAPGAAGVEAAVAKADAAEQQVRARVRAAGAGGPGPARAGGALVCP